MAIKQLNVEIVSDKVTTRTIPKLGGGSYHINRHFTVVKGVFIDSDGVCELHAHGDLKRIEFLEKELENLKLKHYALLEMNRNFVKYDMPVSKEILADRLNRQFDMQKLILNE